MVFSELVQIALQLLFLVSKTRVLKGSICKIKNNLFLEEFVGTYNSNPCGKAVTKAILFFGWNIQPVIPGYLLARKITGILFRWNMNGNGNSMVDTDITDNMAQLYFQVPSGILAGTLLAYVGVGRYLTLRVYNSLSGFYLSAAAYRRVG